MNAIITDVYLDRAFTYTYKFALSCSLGSLLACSAITCVLSLWGVMAVIGGAERESACSSPTAELEGCAHS